MPEWSQGLHLSLGIEQDAGLEQHNARELQVGAMSSQVQET